MALSTDSIRASHGGSPTGTESYVITNTSVIFAGALVGIDQSTGLLVKWADTANFRFLGVAVRGATGLTAGTPPVEAEVNTSGVTLERVTATGLDATADVGDLVHATDDDTLTLTAGANTSAIGRVVRFHGGTSGDVKLFTPDEYRALAGA